LNPMNPLKIEVTEAMAERVLVKFLEWGGDKEVFPPEVNREYRINALRVALTAAFQHPEFRRQFLAQVLDALPSPGAQVIGPMFTVGWDEAIKTARASLGRLLGEEG
jgi:hypothetical protein